MDDTTPPLAREPFLHPSDAHNMHIVGTVLLQPKNFLDFNSPVASIADTISELFGQNVKMALVGVQGRRSLTTHVDKWLHTPTGILTSDAGITYPVEFTVDKDFGTPGALLVESHHPNEFFLKSVTLTPPDSTNIHFVCNSWVNNASHYTGPRIFFANKVYLPSQTPAGLQDLRLEELSNLQGQADPTGERQSADRIYDYDVYNDLGNPDDNEALKRPVLGGSKEYPYPRRCRTNRKRTKTDPASESPVSSLEDIYVPRDEQFGHIKESDFLGSAIKSFAHYILPIIEDLFEKDTSFSSFQEISDLYIKGLDLSKCKERTDEERQAKFTDPLELIRQLTSEKTDPSLLKYPVPSVIQEKRENWVSDEEFARETLSGLNPMVIERLKVFPPESSLDVTYGPQKSTITHQHIEPFLEGLTAEKAVEESRLFIVDYHDVYISFLNKINDLEGKGYASRSLFFLTTQGTLKPIAVELSLPPNTSTGFSGLQKVFTPNDSLEWMLAKTHAVINDAGYHQLVSHLLRTHVCIEPFIIATYRQISALHPLYVLLTPHFKNTMNINALARKALINCNSGSTLIGGIVEKSFTPTKYSLEMSSAVYKSWRFDEQGLPADLIKRGMAEVDPSAEHGLRLFVKDYPFAVDGLEIWSAIQTWVHDYLRHYYKDDAAVREDTELQSWWTEIREVGHGDKSKERWWAAMQTVKELEEAVVTLIWVASAHHAAVNFGQYAYAGYMPNKPTMGRKLIPEQGTLEYEQLQKDPEKFYLEMVSSRSQATIVMTTIEILSEHSSDEEYLGQRATPDWTNDEEILGAFQRFGQRLSVVEEKMKARNADPELKNRVGAVRVPYTLLMPTSGEGLTGKGIPNSTSI